MSLADDLLEQARHLAVRERTRPRQASLRRAVSAAYYALFHLLVAEESAVIGQPKPIALRRQIGRAFGHADMKSACRQFSGRDRLPAAVAALVAAPIDARLTEIAATFLRLQEERHAADYDVTRSFNRVSVNALIAAATSAFNNRRHIRSTTNATVFLTALLLHRQ